MPGKFKYLSSLAQEIEKLEFEVEEGAKTIVTANVAAVREKAKATYEKAQRRLDESREAVGALDKALDTVNAALGDNSGERKNPT